jgi:hypothetical protein
MAQGVGGGQRGRRGLRHRTCEDVELVCSGGEDAIHVVRGPGFQSRLRVGGPAASGLIDDLTNKDSKDCPVSGALTDADRADLSGIK